MAELIKTPQQSVSGALGHAGLLTIVRTNGCIQITFPGKLFEEKPKRLEISWIDAYR